MESAVMESAVAWVEPAVDESAVDDPPTAQGSPSVGAAEVREVRRALGALSRRVRAHGHGTSTPRTEWAELVAGCQALVNTATAIQDVAITRVAAVEEEWLEDGTFVEVPRAPGHVALDAPDVVAGSLCVSHPHAQRRVSLAVRVAADGDQAAGTDSGLGALHAAMLDGRLDGYRAGVVAEELAEAPSEVAAAVVEALEEHLGSESAAQLRRRSRRVLARISPDLLRQRARRAREACGLRRWADEPGVDHWEGTFPSEDAALGWASVDALARRYVKEGVCDRLEAARGRALIELVTGQATIEVTVVVTVPETADPMDAAGPPPERGPEPGDGVEPPDDTAHADTAADVDDLIEVMGPFAGDPLLVRRAWLVGLLGSGEVLFARCHRRTGALLDDRRAWTTAYRPTAETVAVVRTRDGRCRFPGCAVAARFCDLDHVRPWPWGPTRAGNLMCLCRRHHRIKQRPGWSVRLHRDGRATWTDPVGRRRTTWPRDLLDLVVLPAPRAPATGGATPGEAPAAASGSLYSDPTSTPGTGTDPTTTAEPPTSPSARAAGETALEVLLGVLADHDPARDPWNRRGGATAAARTPGHPRVLLVRPDPRRHVRYEGRPCRRGRTRQGTGARSPADAADTGPPPF